MARGGVMQRRGLTLKELLVAVAVIVLLIGLLFPVIRIIRYRTLEARFRANLMAIMAKYQELRQQHQDRWRARKELNHWLAHDLEGRKVAFCPVAEEPYGLYRVVIETWHVGITNPDALVTWLNPEIVVYCPCHVNPPRPMRACSSSAPPSPLQRY